MEFDEIYSFTQNLKVLYVEDDISLQRETLTVFENYFFSVDSAVNGAEALELYKNNEYDLVITDINMPIMDGETLINEIKSINSLQEIIVVSAYSDADRLIALIQLNISSFLLKPIQFEQLSDTFYKVSKKVSFEKQMKIYHQSIDERAIELDKKVLELSQEINFTQEISIETIADMVESYDDETGSHTKRIQQFTKLLVARIPEDAGCPEDLKEFVPFASLLHDLGKMYIPRQILKKPAALTEDERLIMNTHAKLGGDMLRRANQKFKHKYKKDSFFKVASDIAMYHHEKYDGSGYPEGLKADEIPMCARIVALVDVYDALRSKRVYKAAFSHQKAVEIIKSERGASFDPVVVDMFLELQDQFNQVFTTLGRVKR